MTRLLIVVALLALFAAARWWWRRRTEMLQSIAAGDQVLPSDLVSGERTWVVFTTPTCATCGPVIEHLRRSDPIATVHRLDATEHPELADRYHVKAAPTLLRAGIDGRIDLRLSGPAAATAHFDLVLENETRTPRAHSVLQNGG